MKIEIDEYLPWESGTVFPDQQYGRLTVISTHVKMGTYKYFAKCRCSCGNEIFVRLDALRKPEGKTRKPTRSCGCYHVDQVTKHGVWQHPLYHVWHRMMKRCYDPTNKRYPRYGGRGIDVCESWHDIKNFIVDMHPTHKPGLQINRIDNDKGYSKDNCNWANRTEQAQNKSDTVAISFNGKTMSMRQWAIHLGINYGTLVERIRVLHWPIEKALSQPSRKGNYHWRKS